MPWRFCKKMSLNSFKKYPRKFCNVLESKIKKIVGTILVILVNLCMPGNTHLKWQVELWRNLCHLSAGKKSTSSFTFSLWYCKDIVNMLFWVLWDGWLSTTKVILLPYRKLVFICRQKISFISYALLEILQRYANLFWVLWEYPLTHTQNDIINL